MYYLYKLTWLRCNKASRKNEPMFAETRIAVHRPLSLNTFGSDVTETVNVTLTFNLAYQPVGL